MREDGDRIARDHLLQGKPKNTTHNESFVRHLVNNDVATVLASEEMTAVAVPCQVGDVVAAITFVSGATAAVDPAHWWFALYSDAGTPALLGQTADQLTAAWAQDTAKTLPLVTPVVVPRPGVYYAVCMVAAATVPSLLCASLATAAASDAVVTGQRVLALRSGAGLAGVAPATLANPSTMPDVPYCVLT